MILMYSRLSAISWKPGSLNSNQNKIEKAIPDQPENKAKIKYKISISFEDKNHRSVHKDRLVFNIGTLYLCDRSASAFIFMFLLNKTLSGWRWETGKTSSQWH